MNHTAPGIGPSKDSYVGYGGGQRAPETQGGASRRPAAQKPVRKGDIGELQR